MGSAGVVLPPRGHMVMFGDIFDCHHLEEGCSWHLEDRGEGCCVRRTPVIKNCLAQNVSGDAVAKNGSQCV